MYFLYGIVALIFAVILYCIIHIFHKEIPPDLSLALHGIISEDGVNMKYDKKESIQLSKGDLVYIIQDNYLTNSYTVSFQGHIGNIPKQNVLFYQHHPHEKYSLMVDVSEFNMRDNFKSSGDFAFFIIENGINYVYMRLGGRGYGEKGNLYYDSKVDDYITICDFLKIPYGFYYLDEALNEDEVLEEVHFVEAFLNKHHASMNVLPLAIDLEFQEGAGRADYSWDKRTELLEKLIAEFQREGISTILYANALRAKDYLSSLDCDFWVARYPQNGIIPNGNFTEFITIDQAKTLTNYVLGKDNKLKSNLNTNKEFMNSYPEEFLEKIIGWQFTSSGAQKDGIDESIDLSIVSNAFFKKFLIQEKE